MHSLCGYSLEKGTKIIAIVQMVSVIVCVGIAAWTIINELGDIYNNTTEIVVLAIILLLLLAVGCFLSYLLYTGASKKSVVRLTIWLVISWLGYIITVVNLIRELLGSQDPMIISLHAIQLVIQLWVNWVVHEFRAELKNARNSRNLDPEIY